MVRGRIEMRRIENSTSRMVTFTKRRKGLFKKANELSILCEARVGVIIFSPTSRVYEFASNGNMKKVLEDYDRADEESRVLNSSSEAKMWRLEAETLRGKLEDLGKQHRVLMGEDLAGLNFQQVENLQTQLEATITAVRRTKEALMERKKTESNCSRVNVLHIQNGNIGNKGSLLETEEHRVERRSSNSIDENEPSPSLDLTLSLPQAD